MTFDETRTILKIIKAEWPQSFRGMTREDAEAKLALWAEMFADDDPVLVGAAVKALIVGGGREFAPNVGIIKDKMRQLVQPESMTEAEAWALVQKAIRRSGYNSAEEYGKLPPLLQRLVGSPSQLREWSMMDSDTVQSVVASNFQRAYRVRAKQDAEWQAIPADVKASISAVASRLALTSREEATA